MAGDINSRHNLGCLEVNAGNYDRAYKHFLLSARAGDTNSLDSVKIGFREGSVTKDEYENTLRAYQSRHDETKSAMREKARALIRSTV